MAKLVAGTYGEALFELALENNTIDTMLEEIKSVKKVFSENDELIKLLNHPKIDKDEKISVLEKIFENQVSREVTGFLVIITEKGRQDQIGEILDYFINRVREYKNIGVAEVTSALPLSEDQKKKMEQKLLATTKYVEMQMHYQVDSSLIGGVVIRIGDRVVDGSIKSKLAEMTKSLQKIQLSEI